MQPQTPAPMPNGGKDPYGFIMNAGAPVPKGVYGKKPSTMKTRLLIVTIVGVVLIMIGGAVFNLIFNSGPNLSENLTQIAYKQAEIVRIADLGGRNARSSATQNFAYNTKLTVLTDELAVVNYYKSKGGGLTVETLNTRKNAQNDAALTKAQQANAYDETLTQMLKDQLTAYQKDLTDTFNIVTDSKGKKVLNDSFNHANALLKQLEPQ